MSSRWVGKLCKLVGSLGLLGYLAYRTDWTLLRANLALVRWEGWLAGVAFFCSLQLVSSWRWRLFGSALGFTQPWREYARLYFLGMFTNLFLPSSMGGDVVRGWQLAAEPARRPQALLSVFAERLSGLFVLLCLAGLAVLLRPPGLPDWLAGLVGSVAGAGVLVLLLSPWLAKSLGRQPRLRLLAEAHTAFGNKPGLLLKTTLLSLLVQSGNVLLVAYLGWALGVQVPGLYYWVLVPVVSLLTLLPISLNGMGVREASMVLLLQPLGVEPAQAMCLAVLWFATLTTASLLGWLASWPTRPVKEIANEQSHHHVGADVISLDRDSPEGRAGQPPAAA